MPALGVVVHHHPQIVRDARQRQHGGVVAVELVPERVALLVVQVATGELLDLFVGERIDLDLLQRQLAVIILRAAAKDQAVAGRQGCGELSPLDHTLGIFLAPRLVEGIGQQAQAPLLPAADEIVFGLARHLLTPHARQELLRGFLRFLRGKAHQ